MAGRQGWNLRSGGPSRRDKRGEQAFNWKGDGITVEAGRIRARVAYPDIGECVSCGRPAHDRHHVDGNTLNNAPENVRALCRRCHMNEDGRLEAVVAGLRRISTPQPPKPCTICKAPSKPLTRGRCKACLMYLRRTGTERPESMHGRTYRPRAEVQAEREERRAAPCMTCGVPVGEHTTGAYRACLAANARKAHTKKAA